MSTKSAILSDIGAPATAAWNDAITGFGVGSNDVYFPIDGEGHPITDAAGDALAWTAEWQLAPVVGTPMAGAPVEFLVWPPASVLPDPPAAPSPAPEAAPPGPAAPAVSPPTATAVSGTPAPVALAPESVPAPSPTAAVVAANSPAAIVAANPAPVVSVHQHPHTGGFIVHVEHLAQEAEDFVVRSFEEVKAKIEAIYRAHFRANPTK